MHTLYAVAGLYTMAVYTDSPQPMVNDLFLKLTDFGAAQTVTLQVAFTPL